MVIENEQGYNNLLSRLQGKSVCAVFVRDDNRNHPAESVPIFASIYFDNEYHDIVFSHSESFSENLDINKLSCIKRFWVDDVKEFYHLTKLTNGYDVRLYNKMHNKEFITDEEPAIFQHIYENTFATRKSNNIIPIVKIIEYAHNRLSQIISNIPKTVAKPYLKYNKALFEFAKLENSGMKIIPNSFGTVFRNGYGFTNYNLLTATGRPSNTFRGVNFGALNKNDNTRNNIITRFKEGMLVEFDYDAYHLRLLSQLLKIEVPIDQSLHQHLADTVYKTSYEEAKRISWQILYGNIHVSEKENPFFYKVENMADLLWKYFKHNKCFKSPIYNRIFESSQIIDSNKKKVLNYFIQSYETEKNIETIKKLNSFLKSRSTRMILYTYDSFLFDLDRSEGLKTILQIKEILQDNKFPVKVKAGLNYGSMQDITERINGYK